MVPVGYHSVKVLHLRLARSTWHRLRKQDNHEGSCSLLVLGISDPPRRVKGRPKQKEHATFMLIKISIWNMLLSWNGIWQLSAFVATQRWIFFIWCLIHLGEKNKYTLKYIFPCVSDQIGRLCHRGFIEEKQTQQNAHKAPVDCKYMSSFLMKPHIYCTKATNNEELYPCQCIIIKYQWTLSQTAHCSVINPQCWGWTLYWNATKR